MTSDLLLDQLLNGRLLTRQHEARPVTRILILRGKELYTFTPAAPRSWWAICWMLACACWWARRGY